MKKLILLLTCAILMVGTTTVDAQKRIKPSGNIIAKKFELKEFRGVSSSSGINVYITQGSEFKVKVKTDENVMPYVSVKVKNNMLNIQYSKSIRLNKIKTSVYITMPHVDVLKASSGSNIKVAEISGKSLSITTSSAAEVKAMVNYDKLFLTSSSGAEIELKGRADSCKANASSGAEIDVEKVICREVVANASSGADIELHVTESLDANVSSGAKIEYYGNPLNTYVNKSSGGSVRKKND